MADTVVCKNCGKPEVRCIGLCRNCYSKHTARKIKERHDITVTVIQKGWTRYGGVNGGYQLTEDRKEWNCQACGDQQPFGITAYLFPFEGSDVLRICPECQNQVIKNAIERFDKLLDLVR